MKIKTRTSPLLAAILAMSSILSNPVFAQTFTKVTTGPLVTTPGDSRSVAWVDVNNDGFIDCMITNGPAGGQNNMLYLNDGIGGFTALTGSPIVQDGQPSDGATWADTDNDGDLDCYVANWYNTSNLFYLNNGTGAFSLNATSLITVSGGYCETASWGDYDRDGRVDLYVTNSGGVNKNLLFHNDSNNVFTKITTGDVANDISDSRGVNWVDIDGDRDADLFVTNESNGNEFIYRNDGGSFVTLTAGPLLNSGGHTMSSSWGDYDNDGDLDVFLANDGSLNALYRNDGAFNFTKMAADTVSKTPGKSFSSAWSDVDNDGDLDLYVTNSFGTAMHQNFMYLNNGGSFTRVSTGAPVTDVDWSYGCAFGDYDNDGFEDLAVATCRFGGTDRPDLLYHNDGNGNKWITIKLTGVTTNRSAIGAKVRVKATIGGTPVWQMREISAQSGYCSQNDLRAHFGLGAATTIDSIRIEWPSGTTDVYQNVTTNQFVAITEGQSPTAVRAASEKDFSIFPNPGRDFLTIQATGWQLQRGDRITITSMGGSIVHEHVITESTDNYRLNGRLLAAGEYTVTIRTGGEVVVRKIVRL